MTKIIKKYEMYGIEKEEIQVKEITQKKYWEMVNKYDIKNVKETRKKIEDQYSLTIIEVTKIELKKSKGMRFIKITEIGTIYFENKEYIKGKNKNE